MKYLCLIYDEEKTMAGMSKAEGDAFMGEYFAFTEGIKKTGHYIGGEALKPVHTATTVRIRQGKMSTTDGPFAETKEQLGGYLPDRRQGSERSHSDCGEDSVGPDGQRRSAADRGVRLASRGERAREMVDAVYRADSRRVLATLIRLLGDFDLAEEAMHDAFAAAIEQWPRDGVPDNPRAWLVSAGRFKAIDAMRRRARFDRLRTGIQNASARQVLRLTNPTNPRIPRIRRTHEPDDAVEDDRLRLIFTCCHPALTPDAQVALTLREVCALTTEEIGRAFLINPPTVAQRIVRAKAKIRDARIPYQVPSRDELPDRLDAVLHVVYLVFNEGYSASSGTSLTRCDVSAEAIRLGRLLVELLPEPEAVGLLALMLLHESRRAARSTPDGELVLLDDQDRTLWDRALDRRRPVAGRARTLVAALRAVHAAGGDCRRARRRCHRDETDWAQIVGLYDVLARADAVSRYRAEPRGSDRDARRPGDGTCDGQRHHGPRRSRRLLPRPLGSRGFVPASGTICRRTRGVSARARACASGAGTKILGQEVERIGRLVD